MHVQLAAGRRFRVLNMVDDVTRECLRTVADTSISWRRVVRELALSMLSRPTCADNRPIGDAMRAKAGLPP